MVSAAAMLVGGWVKACVPKEKGECYWQTCGVLDEVFGPAAWGRGHGECWDGYGLSLQGSWGRWSWVNYFGKSFHLSKRATLLVGLTSKSCNQNMLRSPPDWVKSGVGRRAAVGE